MPDTWPGHERLSNIKYHIVTMNQFSTRKIQRDVFNMTILRLNIDKRYVNSCLSICRRAELSSGTFVVGDRHRFDSRCRRTYRPVIHPDRDRCAVAQRT